MMSLRSRHHGQPRLRALRELYKSFWFENTPEGRGRRLLLEWLTDEQRAQFLQHRYFDVTGCDSAIATASTMASTQIYTRSMRLAGR
jgi:hypothetical protein